MKYISIKFYWKVFLTDIMTLIVILLFYFRLLKYKKGWKGTFSKKTLYVYKDTEFICLGVRYELGYGLFYHMKRTCDTGNEYYLINPQDI